MVLTLKKKNKTWKRNKNCWGRGMLFKTQRPGEVNEESNVREETQRSHQAARWVSRGRESQLSEWQVTMPQVGGMLGLRPSLTLAFLEGRNRQSSLILQKHSFSTC